MALGMKDDNQDDRILMQAMNNAVLALSTTQLISKSVIKSISSSLFCKVEYFLLCLTVGKNFQKPFSSLNIFPEVLHIRESKNQAQNKPFWGPKRNQFCLKYRSFVL